jgi:hypothetical protein
VPGGTIRSKAGSTTSTGRRSDSNIELKISLPGPPNSPLQARNSQRFRHDVYHDVYSPRQAWGPLAQEVGGHFGDDPQAALHCDRSRTEAARIG